MNKNDLGLLKNTHIQKKDWSFHDFDKKYWWFVSLVVEKKNHQSWEPVLVTKLCLCQKKPKTPTKMKFFDKKSMMS